MPREAFHYHFNEKIDLDEIREELSIAKGHVDSLYGPARLQLELFYFVDDEQQTVTVDASTEVGRDFNRILAGTLLRTIGDELFSVRRSDRDPRAAAKEGE